MLFLFGIFCWLKTMKTNTMSFNRRTFIKGALTTTAACGLFRPQRSLGAVADVLPPVRQITRGPKFHWRGYYDKLLFDPTNRRVPLGHFLFPKEYKGEWRCDTHPSASRDGKRVTIDSTHNTGRQLYLIDIQGLL